MASEIATPYIKTCFIPNPTTLLVVKGKRRRERGGRFKYLQRFLIAAQHNSNGSVPRRVIKDQLSYKSHGWQALKSGKPIAISCLCSQTSNLSFRQTIEKDNVLLHLHHPGDPNREIGLISRCHYDSWLNGNSLRKWLVLNLLRFDWTKLTFTKNGSWRLTGSSPCAWSGFGWLCGKGLRTINLCKWVSFLTVAQLYLKRGASQSKLWASRSGLLLGCRCLS